MAEFMEVMHQAKRMCTAHDSYCIYDDCPLADGEECRLNVNMDGEDYIYNNDIMVLYNLEDSLDE